MRNSGWLKMDQADEALALIYEEAAWKLLHLCRIASCLVHASLVACRLALRPLVPHRTPALCFAKMAEEPSYLAGYVPVRFADYLQVSNDFRASKRESQHFSLHHSRWAKAGPPSQL